MAKGKFWDRHSLKSLEKGTGGDPKGRIFISRAGMADHSKVLLCGSSVDTVRQLYYGTMDPDQLDRIKATIEAQIFEIEHRPFGRWHVGKMSKISGFRYKLQNNDEGIVILFGSYYVQEDRAGAHLKIELSPHFIAQRGVKEIQDRSNQIAQAFLKDPVPSGVAVHLALDVQNWTLPHTFEQRFVTYARAKRSYDGLTTAEFEDLSGVAVRYGKSEVETLMYGKASGLQTVIYNKTKEIKVTDKVDYFHGLWTAYTFGDFDPEKPVWRIEMRFHHQVVREVGEGLGETLHSFQDVAPYLTDLWRYALMKNRLDHSSTYIDPIWQLFLEDAEFVHPAQGLWIRRKKKQDVSSVGRNFAAIIGNLISLSARQNQTVGHVMKQLKRLDCFDDLLRYYRLRHMSEADLRQQIEKGLALRRLIGKAA